MKFLFMRQDFLTLRRVQRKSENIKRIMSHEESMPKNIEFSVITFSLVFDGDFSNLKAAHALYMTSSVCDAQPS